MAFMKGAGFEILIIPILFVPLILFQARSWIPFGVYGELTVFPVDAVVEVGSDVRLNCTTSSTKPVNWQHGKVPEKMADLYIGGEGLVRPYSKSNRHSMDEDKTTGRYDLIIKSVTREDEGIYVCSEKASRDNPPQARLTVTGSSPQQPYCLNYEICKAGEEAKLEYPTCAAKPFFIDHVPVGKSHADDVYNNGKLLNDYARSGRFRVADSGNFCVLSIANVKNLDAGTYTCRERSGLGQRHDKDLIVREETCGNTNDIASKPGANEEPAGNCTVRYVGHPDPLIRWIESNCNGSICHVTNVTNGSFPFCQTLDRASEGPLFCEMIDPTSESILVLGCEFSCKNDHVDTGASTESHKLLGLWMALAGVISLGVVGLSICIVYKKKRDQPSPPASRRQDRKDAKSPSEASPIARRGCSRSGNQGLKNKDYAI